MKHAEVLEDWKYLFETIGPAHDMSGYIDQDDLDALLKHPTKRQAVRCLTNQIIYWFDKGPAASTGDESFGMDCAKARDALDELIETNPRVAEIKERYHC